MSSMPVVFPPTLTLSYAEGGLEVSVVLRLPESDATAFAALARSNGETHQDACCEAFAQSGPALVPRVVALHAQFQRDAHVALALKVRADRRRASQTSDEVSPQHAPASEATS